MLKKYILVSPTLVKETQTPVQLYLMYHELGHIKRGHSRFTTLFFVLLNSIIVISALLAGIYPPVPLDFLPSYTGMVIVIFILLFGVFLLWKNSYNELDADLFAAQKIGQEAAIAAIKILFSNDEKYRKSFALLSSYVSLSDRVDYIKKKMIS